MSKDIFHPFKSLKGFTGMERRKYVRLATILNVDFKINGEGSDVSMHRGMTRDISQEGICLVTDAFFKEEWKEIAREKKHLSLYISFPGYKEKKVSAAAEVLKIDAKAEIVWQRHEEREGKDMCSLGLHFVNIERDGQEIIKSFIADNLLARYQPV